MRPTYDVVDARPDAGIPMCVTGINSLASAVRVGSALARHLRPVRVFEVSPAHLVNDSWLSGVKIVREWR